MENSDNAIIKLLEQYDLKFDEDEIKKNNLKCRFCDKLMLNPVQIINCGCRFCSKCITDKFNYSKRGITCPGNSGWCNVINSLIEDLHIDESSIIKMSNLMTNCPNCSKSMTLYDLVSHITECSEIPVVNENCNIDINNELVEDREIVYNQKLDSQDENYSIIDSEELRNIGNNYSDNTSENNDSMIHNLEKEIDQMMIKQQRIDQLIRENRKLKQNIHGLKQDIKQCRDDNRFVWKIKNLLFIPRRYVSSEEFYLKKYGYKMKMFLFPHCKHRHDQNHVSIYVQLVHGEWDDILRWPFDDEITISLLPDPNRDQTQFSKSVNIRYYRPEIEQNEVIDGVGLKFFCSHEILKQYQFRTMNDYDSYVYISCQMGASH